MTDNQLQVQLGETTPDGRARAAALQAASGAGWQPTAVVTYQSTGRLLVTGSRSAVEAAMAALAGQAGLSLTALVPGDTDERPALSGWLGRFELQGSGTETQTFDMVLMDCMMPEMDGFEVCRKLRRDGNTVPVIFLTARDDIDDKRVGFRQGGDDYLTKPFSLEELGLRIEALLRRAGGPTESSRLAIDDLVIDDDAHQVWNGEDEVQLSPTEFRLLRFLALNKGRVMSKGQIVDYVWEYDFDGNYGIVETYVSYLRKKLGDSDGSLIQTVRGVGYVIRSRGA